MPKISILHLIASNFVGGPEKQILNHASGIDSSKFEIHIGSFSEGRPLNPILQEAGRRNLPVFQIKSPNSFSPAQIFQLKSFLQRQQIRILCTHGYKANFVGFWAALFTKIPQMAFVRGWTGEDWKVRIYDGLDKFIVRFADLIICVSQAKKEELRNLRVSEHKIAVVYNAFDLKNLKLTPGLDIKQIFQIPKAGIIIAGFGRLSPEKGQIDLVRAAKKVLERSENIYFLLFGDGKQQVPLQDMITRLNIDKNVILAGFVNNPLDYMNQVDLIVNPSLTEGLPNVILEALALRKPVVATAVGGVPEIIQDGVSGHLVRPGNPHDLAEKILFVLDNPSIMAKTAENGYQLLQDKCCV